MQVSEHRKHLNETLMPDWGKQFHTYDTVYDIGKSVTWDYSADFRCKFLTIDRDKSLEPDICINLENGERQGLKADGVIFNGVFEQCDNPFSLMEGILSLLNPQGKILAGLASIGMVPYGEKDKWRVTRNGVLAYMKYFRITQLTEFPEYFFVLGEKL